MSSWTGTARSNVLTVIGVLVVVMGLAYLLGATAADDGDATALVIAGFGLFVIAAAVVAFARVEVVVDVQGVRIRSRPIAIARVTLPLDDIERARVINHRPLQWGVSGGWGYRGSLRLFRKAAWVLRSGPAIELELTRGRRFVVTVDDPGAGVAVLNALLAPPTPRGG